MLRKAKDRKEALARGEYVQPRWKDWQDHRSEQAAMRKIMEERVPGCRLTNNEIRMESLRDIVIYEPQELTRRQRIDYNNSMEQYARAHFKW
jgi:hypothetical protein